MESLMESKLKGPLLDTIVTKKLSESKLLATQLSGYAPLHELEALRRMVMEGQRVSACCW